MRETYWDSILIGDDDIPSELIDKAIACYDKTIFETGVVEGLDEGDYKYEALDGNLDGVSEEILNYLLESKAIPVLDGHKVKNVIRAHKLTSGGKMGWHSDYCYSIAVSIYLSGCVGGELQIKSQFDETKSLMIEPRLNRYVVMKCDNNHRVNLVESGERKSIQIFITYTKGD